MDMLAAVEEAVADTEEMAEMDQVVMAGIMVLQEVAVADLVQMVEMDHIWVVQAAVEDGDVMVQTVPDIMEVAEVDLGLVTLVVVGWLVLFQNLNLCIFQEMMDVSLSVI